MLQIATILVFASCAKTNLTLLDIKAIDSEIVSGKAPVKPPPSTERLDTLIARAPAGSTLTLTKGKIYDVDTTITIDKPPDHRWHGRNN